MSFELVEIGINAAISVIAGDCLTSLILALGSLTIVFMCYFALEAVRTENMYQLAAYAVTSAYFLGSYVPPLVGSTDGPHHIHVERSESELKALLLAALICTCSLQLCVLHAALPSPLLSCAAARYAGVMSPQLNYA